VIAYVGAEGITLGRVADVLGVADRRLLVQLAEAVLGRDVAEALRLVALAVDRGVDMGQLARSFLGYLHDLEVIALCADATDLVDATADEIGEAKALAAKAPRGLLGALFDRWARAVEEAGRSQTPRLILEMALVDLCFSEPLLPLANLLDRLQELEARLAAGGGGGGGAVTDPGRRSVPGPGSVPEPAPIARSPEATTLSPKADPTEAWRKVCEHFTERASLAAALDHAEIAEWTSGRITQITDIVIETR
jgi:DNA polymerase-3 subunit gamma/tau